VRSAEKLTSRSVLSSSSIHFQSTPLGAFSISPRTRSTIPSRRSHVGPGSTVLVNGASGCVGTFAVQIAKSLGAQVTGVCSPPNVEIARSAGADRVIDYTQEDFTRTDERCDATLVFVGGPKTNRLYGPLGKRVVDRLASVQMSQHVALFVAKLDKDDLAALGELIEAGSVTSVIDRQYELGDLGDALDYLAQGHARGKVVIAV